LTALWGEPMPSALSQINGADIFRHTEPMRHKVLTSPHGRREGVQPCNHRYRRRAISPGKTLDRAIQVFTVGGFWIAQSSPATTAQ